jgi:5-deoxy-D-glucuronate isomerase
VITRKWRTYLGQKEVYDILKEMGGTATTKQISQKAKDLFPQYALWSYVGFTLRKLGKNGYVSRVKKEDQQITWKIIRDYP